MTSVLKVCDELFHKVEFDKNLYKKIMYNNIEFISKTDDHKNLFGSRLIGCHYLRYNLTDKADFYDTLFNLDYDIVSESFEQITTIPKNFKIARDDINLTCFYSAHKFLTNTQLKEEDRENAAIEILNYFNYRTLVVICANYFIYPISEDKAVSLIERLSNKYLIKKLKNWNEYCQYRSEEYLKSKFRDTIIRFDEKELPNAISDLFNRTKDTIKNIYSEFIAMIQSDEYIKSKKAVVNDIEGEEVILDQIGNTKSYFNLIETMFIDKHSFIRSSYIDVIVDIISTVSYSQVYEMLEFLFDYTQKSSKNYEEVVKFSQEVLMNTVDYLQKNKILLNYNTNILTVLNYIVGNILYARGNDLSINKVKEEGEKLLKKVYKENKEYLSDRNAKNLRNALYLYIVLFVLLGKEK